MKLLDTIFGDVSPMLFILCLTKEQVETIKELYLSYLQKKYANSISMAESCGQDLFLSEFINTIIEDEKEQWSGLTFDEVLNLLDEDEACNRLKEISFEIFDQAKNAKLYNTSIGDDDKYKAIEKNVMDVYSQIRSCNQEIMSDLLSETLLDINYIYGKSKDESMRLSHEQGVSFEDNSFGDFEQFITNVEFSND